MLKNLGKVVERIYFFDRFRFRKMTEESESHDFVDGTEVPAHLKVEKREIVDVTEVPEIVYDLRFSMITQLRK